MEERTGSAEGYRFGFQGQETDDEVYGSENAVSFKYRVHDARIGRFLSLDPLAPEYPWNSPYAFSENKVIQFIELEGLQTGPSAVAARPQTRPATGRATQMDVVRGGNRGDAIDRARDAQARDRHTATYDTYPYAPTTVGVAQNNARFFYLLLDTFGVFDTETSSAGPTTDLDEIERRLAWAEANLGPQNGLRDLDREQEAAENVAAGRGTAEDYNIVNGKRALFIEARTNEGGEEVYYRTISMADYNSLLQTGKLPATTETSTSSVQAYSSRFDGVLVKFRLEPGTTEALLDIGVREEGQPLTSTLGLPVGSEGWGSLNARFKQERGQVTIALGFGRALEIFNQNIVEFEKVE